MLFVLERVVWVECFCGWRDSVRGVGGVIDSVGDVPAWVTSVVCQRG